MNVSDSERIAAGLEKKNYKVAKSIKDADLIIVNMCSVRQSAVNRAFSVGHKILKLKASNPKIRAILTGCVVKSDKRKFREKFDEIWDNKKFLDIPPKCQDKFLAFIPISYGCNNFCAYCVVPYTRGSLTCRDHKKIIKEAKLAAKNGAKEIWLLGQNVNDYKDGKINFARLLKMVNDIPGDFQIRFMSPNPKNFTDELIGIMANSKKVAKFLNLPIQSGNNEILKKMNRPYTAAQYKNLVKKIRKAMSDINLSTDVIVGFPGETKKQFQNTVKLFKEIKFNIAYISKYSPRSGTAAFKIEDNIPLEEKKKRWKILNDIILKNGNAGKK